MIHFLWSRRESLGGFAVVLLLVVGGLACVTRAALRVELEQTTQKTQAEHADNLRLALWRLDSRMNTILAREDSRPFNHYSAVFAPPVAFDATGNAWPSGAILEPSPLLSGELPPWMLLHFQTDVLGWESPQVLSPALLGWMGRTPGRSPPTNVTPARQRLLAELGQELPAPTLMAHARRHAGEATIRDRVLMARALTFDLMNNALTKDAQAAQTEYAYRAGDQSKLANYASRNLARVEKEVALFNSCRNGEEWLLPTYTGRTSTKALQTGVQAPQARTGAPASTPPALVTNTVDGKKSLGTGPPTRSSAEVTVSMSPMVGVWLPTRTAERLVVVRMVHVEQKEVCQGIVLDGGQLRQLLAEEVQDLFPAAAIEPAHDPGAEDLALTMTALPLRLDPGPVPPPAAPGWTTLRVGLCLAWSAALVALLAVALGGWSLIDLSERRIRFVSAVTHELRTPLTTLRLYLDLLLGGLVRAEQQRQEYLQTLDAETDRLSRLVNNVLDFSRLERQNPRLSLAVTSPATVLASVVGAWGQRCLLANKRLVVDNQADPRVVLKTDAGLLGQVLSNLLDNACKYSRDAEDPLILLRVRSDQRRVVFEVEDRGPGVPKNERRTIFRPFRRGRIADANTGGVGLGLALACRWTQLLGGTVSLDSPAAGGACFRVELPAG